MFVPTPTPKTQLMFNNSNRIIEFYHIFNILEQMTGQSLKDIDECDNLKRIVYEVQTFSGN
jgi:hypothetical protein